MPAVYETFWQRGRSGACGRAVAWRDDLQGKPRSPVRRRDDAQSIKSRSKTAKCYASHSALETGHSSSAQLHLKRVQDYVYALLKVSKLPDFTNPLTADSDTRLISTMEDEDNHSPDSYNDDADYSWEGDTLETQITTLKTYLDHVPYPCESPQEMQAKLEEIIGKITVCAKSRNWSFLTQWDALLSW